MGVKRKVKHKDNVVYLFGDNVLWFQHGFKELAERADAAVDVLVMVVLELSVNGMIQPVCFKKRKGGMELRFRVARDLREAWELRQNIVGKKQLTPEAFEHLSGVREGLFGPIPEDLRH